MRRCGTLIRFVCWTLLTCRKVFKSTAANLWKRASRLRARNRAVEVHREVEVRSGLGAQCRQLKVHRGVGAVQFPPTHGTAVLSELFTPPSTYQIFVTYTHDGSATLSDSFGFNDEYGDRVQVNMTISPATSAIVPSLETISIWPTPICACGR